MKGTGHQVQEKWFLRVCLFLLVNVFDRLVGQISIQMLTQTSIDGHTRIALPKHRVILIRSGFMKPKKTIETLILTIRGQKVILDADLADLYGVPTFRFNEAFKRNRRRFPDDFAFQLTAEEFAALRDPNSSHIAMSSPQTVENEAVTPNWSQFATSSSKHRGAAYRPWAFTEHGALMAANILRSERAVEMSVFVIRAFVSVREHLAANAAILKRLAKIDKTLLKHDSALRTLWTKLQPLLAPPPEKPRRRIGFNPNPE